LNASDIIAFPMVIVDAKDGLIEFYEKFSFSPFLNEDKKLYLSISLLKESLINNSSLCCICLHDKRVNKTPRS